MAIVSFGAASMVNTYTEDVCGSCMLRGGTTRVRIINGVYRKLSKNLPD